VEPAVAAARVLAHHADGLEASLLVAADRALVGCRWIDGDPVMTAVLEQVPGKQTDRLDPSALALKSSRPSVCVAELITTLDEIRRLARIYSVITAAEAIVQLSADMTRPTAAALRCRSHSTTTMRCNSQADSPASLSPYLRRGDIHGMERSRRSSPASTTSSHSLRSL